MKGIIAKGQLLFGIAILAFGVENFFCAHFGVPVGGVAWFPANPFFGYFTGFVLLAAGLSLVANVHSRLTAILVGYLFLAYALFFNLRLIVAHPADWSTYGVLCEALAMCGSAWTLALILPRSSAGWQNVLGKAAVAGPYLFAASLIVFGGIHFLVAHLIAGLIPAWIPGSLFWTYLIGTAFIAAAISIAIRRLDQWAGFLLGIMFLLFVVLVHSPRVAADIHNPDEWSSGLIALAMCGGSWIVARHAQRRSERD
jgi:hypothetical protein